MVGIMKRMRNLRTLLGIKLGPGAAVLPPEITRIHMDFAYNIHDGHYGPRKFWRNCLPRLKYHNPAVSMTVNRTDNQEGSALLTIHYASPSSHTSREISSTTSSNTSSGPVPESKSGPSTERTETINMKHRQESEILEKLLALTNATVVNPTAEETRQLKELEEQQTKSLADQALTAKFVAKQKREAQILAQAKGSLV